MTGTQTLLARSALGFLLAPLGMWLASTTRFQRLSPQTFDRLVTGALIATRLGFFLLLYKILHLAPRGDIPAYYLPQALDVLRHKLPYRDFESSYAPLHPYLDAVFVSLWRSSLSIVLFAVLAECFVLPGWIRLGRSLFAERQVRSAALLYLASPLSLQFVTVDGQDNVFIGLLLLIALACALHFRYVLSAASVAISLVFVKFLPLVLTPTFLVALPRRWRWAASAAILTIPAYAAFAFLHAPILQPLQAEAELRTASNLPFFVESLFNFTLPAAVSNLLVVAAILAITALVARACRGLSQAARVRIIVFGIAAIIFALLLFSKKSWPTYLMLCLFPVCLLPVLEPATPTQRRNRLAAFAVFTLIALTEHSFWSSIFDQPTSAQLHVMLFAGRPLVLAFFFAEFLLLVGYVWLLAECVREIRRTALNSRLGLLIPAEEPLLAEPLRQAS